MAHAEAFPDKGIIQDFMPAIPIHQNIKDVGEWLQSHAEFAPESLRDNTNRLKIVMASAGAVALLAAGAVAERVAYYIAQHS